MLGIGEKMIKSSSSLGGDAIKLTVSKVITLGISMITAMLLSRFRTLEEYGTYSQILLVINLFTSIFMLGLPNSINYFLARAETQEDRKNFLSVYYTLSTILSVIMGGALVCALPVIENYFDNPNIRGFLYFFAMYPWASVVSSSIENVLVVYKETRILMIYRVANSVTLLGSVLIVQWLGLGFSTYMVLYLAVYVVFALAVYVIVSYLSGGLRCLWDKNLIYKIFVFSIPIGLASVVGTLNIEVDKLLIGWLMDTEQLAIYTNASKELPVTIVASSITAVLLPKIVNMIKHNNKTGAVRLWGCATELSYIIICLIVAGVFTYAEDVLALLYSDKYMSGLSVFRVYTLVLLLRCTYFGMILNAYGMTKMIFFSSVISLILNAVLNPIFYFIFGMVGPAVATFLSMLIVILLQLKISAKYMDIKMRTIFPWGSLAKISIINMIFSICFWKLKVYSALDKYTNSIVESIVLGAVWAGIYFLVVRKKVMNLWQKLNGE